LNAPSEQGLLVRRLAAVLAADVVGYWRKSIAASSSNARWRR